MPESVPSDAGQTGAFQNCLEARFQVAKPVTRYRVVENMWAVLHHLLFREDRCRRVVQRNLQPAASLAHDER